LILAKRRKKRLSPEEYVAGILSGNRRILSKAITLVESTLSDDYTLAQEVIRLCLPHSGKSFRLGITGVPGVGKSTFIDAFGTQLTEMGHKVAVLAVDPSSTLSRGSILGDKTRMNRLSHNPHAFIRPSPTRGSLGGVAQKSRESMILCEAAGYDFLIVETVGVGQSEVTVHSMVDFFLLLMLPNAGDELQGIKKGVMEMADALIINKSDGAFLKKARISKVAYSQALRLFPRKTSGWRPPVLLVSALEETGLAKVTDTLFTYQKQMLANGNWIRRRENQATHWLKESIQYRLLSAFFSHPQVEQSLSQWEEAIRKQRSSPAQAADALIAQWFNASKR